MFHGACVSLDAVFAIVLEFFHFGDRTNVFQAGGAWEISNSSTMTHSLHGVKTVNGLLRILSMGSASEEKSATVSKLSHTESIYGALDLVGLKELTAHTFNQCTLEQSYGSLYPVQREKLL